MLPSSPTTLMEDEVLLTSQCFVAGAVVLRYLTRLSHHFIREAHFPAVSSSSGAHPHPSSSSTHPHSFHSHRRRHYHLYEEEDLALSRFYLTTDAEVQQVVKAMVRAAGGNALLGYAQRVHEIWDSDGTNSAFLCLTVTGDVALLGNVLLQQ